MRRGSQAEAVLTLFELDAIGGPLARRLARRRAGTEELQWAELTTLRDASPESVGAARVVWTQSAFSEYASAAAFAQIAAGLLAAGAPIDLCAAAGDFVVDELLHAELSARVAMALGGAVPLEVDLQKLVRPPVGSEPLLRVAELVVRTSCVGESLTVAILQSSREHAGAAVIGDVITRLARDEAEHAELGWTFLDWAGERLSDADRVALGRAATEAVRAFSPLLARDCDDDPSLGVMSCATFDASFARALGRRVTDPLLARGIVIASESAERGLG